MKSQPPQKCPECGQYDFAEIKPENGVAVLLLFILTFFLDLFTPGGRPLQSVEVYNKKKPGWICRKCGWETRIKIKT